MLNTAIVVTKKLVYEILIYFQVWAPYFLYEIMVQTKLLNAGQGISFAFLCIFSDERQLALEILSKDKTVF